MYTLERKIVNQNSDDPIEKIDLHGFSDASFQNYGACIYLRSVSKSGKISVNLVSAKSRLQCVRNEKNREKRRRI